VIALLACVVLLLVLFEARWPTFICLSGLVLTLWVTGVGGLINPLAKVVLIVISAAFGLWLLGAVLEAWGGWRSAYDLAADQRRPGETDWERIHHPQFRRQRIFQRLERKIRAESERQNLDSNIDEKRRRKIEKAALTYVERRWLNFYRLGDFERADSSGYWHLDLDRDR